MDGSFPGNLRVWDGWALTVHDAVAGRPFPGPHQPTEFARRLFATESLSAPSSPARLDEEAEPYSLQWFLDVENRRHRREGRWIPRLLEFAKHSGETLLGLGNGLGTDWIQYARHGASVVVCSPSAQQLTLVRRNFELRGLTGRFLHAPPHNLPLDNASIDVVCLSTLLDDAADPIAVVNEVYRVLKPGGKVLAVAPAKYDVDYWSRLFLPWRAASAAAAVAPGRPYTARGLRRLFGRFSVHRIHRRQLRRSEVPPVWRWLPRPLLERALGRILVLKAFKPLSTALLNQVAA